MQLHSLTFELAVVMLILKIFSGSYLGNHKVLGSRHWSGSVVVQCYSLTLI